MELEEERAALVAEKQRIQDELRDAKAALTRAKRDVAIRGRFMSSAKFSALERKYSECSERVREVDARLGAVRTLRQADDFQRLKNAVLAWMQADGADVPDDEVCNDALDNIRTVMESIEPKLLASDR